MVARGLRSFTQSYLNIVTPLYLASQGVSAIAIGLLVTASFLVSAVLLVPVGILADRYRRLPFLILFSVLIAFWGVAFLVSNSIILLLAMSAIAGIGRGGASGGSGQSGPFGPAEQALLADVVTPARRRDLFALNSFIAGILAAVGAEFSGLPNWLQSLRIENSLLQGFHLLFAETIITSLATVAVLLMVKERAPSLEKPIPEKEQSKLREGTSNKRGWLFSKSSARIVLRQSVAGGINSFGTGFITNSILVYWFYLRFHADASTLGTLFSISYLIGAFGIFFATRLSAKIGSVRSIVASRFAAAALLPLMAVLPGFAVVASLQILRVTLTTMVVPVRQSWTMGLFPAEERASVSAVTGTSRRVAASISPSISGYLFDYGLLETPLFLCAILQVGGSYLYYRFFRKLDDF